MGSTGEEFTLLQLHPLQERRTRETQQQLLKGINGITSSLPAMIAQLPLQNHFLQLKLKKIYLGYFLSIAFHNNHLL